MVIKKTAGGMPKFPFLNTLHITLMLGCIAAQCFPALIIKNDHNQSRGNAHRASVAAVFFWSRTCLMMLSCIAVLTKKRCQGEHVRLPGVSRRRATRGSSCVYGITTRHIFQY